MSSCFASGVCSHRPLSRHGDPLSSASGDHFNYRIYDPSHEPAEVLSASYHVLSKELQVLEETEHLFFYQSMDVFDCYTQEMNHESAKEPLHACLMFPRQAP